MFVIQGLSLQFRVIKFTESDPRLLAGDFCLIVAGDVRVFYVEHDDVMLSRPEVLFPAMKTFYRNLHQTVQWHCSHKNCHKGRGRKDLFVSSQET